MSHKARFPFRAVLTAGLVAAGAPPLLWGQQAPVPWGGYIQARFAQSNDVTGFSIRRTKLWLDGAAPVGKGFHYKVQGLFRPPNGGAFTLQDACLEYRTSMGFLRAGQMVPDFSLERSQPDAEIPLSERAAVINTLIPSATTGARDIGMEVALRPNAARWHATFGVFNGNGGNASQNEDRHFLGTGRAT